MRFGSLFAGIGGIDLGLERAGMACAWQVEIDDYCTRVLEKHWPKVPRFGDVRECGAHNLEPVDLIAGGFPCQPHSVAGKRRGAEDDRNLWPEFSRVIAELRPRYILAENVPGIITTYIDTVLSDLEGQGYACAPLNLPAIAFDAPHRRERIFIVAHRIGIGRKAGASKEGRPKEQEPEGQEPEHLRSDVADTHRTRQLQQGGSKQAQRKRIGDGSDVPHSQSTRLERNERPIMAQQEAGRSNTDIARSDWWTVEPDVGRVAHGIPSRVDRIRGLGNAVVPQVAEWIGRRILTYDKRNVDAGG